MSVTDVQYLTSILLPVLDEPEKLTISRSVDEMGVLLTVGCARHDMGRIIGKEGATAKAIRVILRVFGSKYNERLHMKLLEPQRSVYRKDSTLHDTLQGITSSKGISA